MRRSIRWFLIAVLLLDTAGAVVLLSSTGSPAIAVTEGDTEAGEAVPTADALLLLGRQLAERTEQLRLREVELEELLRSAEVEGRLQELQQAGSTAAGNAPPGKSEPAEPTPDNFAFQKLQRAFENMEPESAAVTLSELAAMDQEAVLQLLSGWSPRTSGAILDALTQTHPRLAAKLSYEIWKRGGKQGPPAASAGR